MHRPNRHLSPAVRPARSKLAGAGGLAYRIGVMILGVPLAGIAAAVPPGTPTFSRDVAPIVFVRCAECHRPEQSAPFSLLTYPQVKTRLKEIAEVIERGVMPPWPPGNPPGELADDRRLAPAEKEVLGRWIAAGGPEGDPADLPPLPKWDPKWRLGTPDLVVEAPAYTLGADGADLYHNYVVPIPLERRRYVRGVEFRPGNTRVVHHAFVQIDATSKSRERAAKQTPPGFDGMEPPETAVMPGGQLLGFQPGKTPSFSPPGLAWTLDPGADLVLQVHMNRTGKPETVQPSVAFYFTDQAPTNRCFRLKLAGFAFEIPPGEPAFRVQQSYTLPVDAQVLRVSLHAHYLGRDLRGRITLPDGTAGDLVRIPAWDFKWQGDYGFNKPVSLPKGTVLTLDYQYDNSTNNHRNPSVPPRPVRWGLQSNDEMAEWTLQLLPVRPEDWTVLATNYAAHFAGVSRDFYRFRIGRNPEDAEAQRKLGRILAAEGHHEEAAVHLREAIRLDPTASDPHFDLGNIHIRAGRVTEAYEEFRQAAKLNPNDSEAIGSLGIIAFKSGRLDVARVFLERAVLLNPGDARARSYLEAVRRQAKP